jgi:hypothetical protein
MKILAILISLTFLLGCDKFKKEPASNKAIIGIWKFKESSGGFSGTGNTVFNDKYVLEYTKSGTYFEYEGKVNRRKTQFKFKNDQNLLNGTSGAIIIYESKTKQSFRVSNDTLYLFDEVNDGFNYIFIK